VLSLVACLAVVFNIYCDSIHPTYLMTRAIHTALTLKYRFLGASDARKISPEARAFETIIRMNEFQAFSDDAETVRTNRANLDVFHTLVPGPRISCANLHLNTSTVPVPGNSNAVSLSGGVAVEWTIYPGVDNSSTAPVILYLHGGGYISGGPYAYSGVVCYLSRHFQMRILFVDYKLAPESPLPNIIGEAIQAYQWLLYTTKIDPSKVIVMGDSAGGGLGLLLMQHIRGITNPRYYAPQPAAAVLLSPYTDLAASGKSVETGADVMIFLPVLKNVARIAVGSNIEMQTSPLVSGLYGTFEGLNPLYIVVGTTELLLDDSLRVVVKAKAAGVEVILEQKEELGHVYPIFLPYLPEATETLNNIQKFIHKRLKLKVDG